jgi:Fur family transcriptional regulator, ferric uptake regulator
MRLGSHHTADEIAAELEASGERFPRSTVYRALDALAASGLVRTVHLGAGPTYYEEAAEQHQHAVCEVCEGILHLEHALVSELEQHLEERHHFKPTRTDVVVVGVCAACAEGGRKRRSGRRTLEHVHFDQ